MGSLKALQEWCRIQCDNYFGVEIRNMTTSFRDGLAFCAIIHRHRPDLIDFDSLSKDNVYENNRLAFETAESELGIPALLDPEDMVSMKVPDRLSVITYVSQYYNYFTNKSHANPPSMKRPSVTGHAEPAVKRPVAADDERAEEARLATPAQMGAEDDQLKRSTLSSTCAACRKHVHLVQRFLVDGKLYHRNCFRCRECCSTLLPGSYKAGNSDEEEEKGEETSDKCAANGGLPSTPVSRWGGAGRPVPAPRRVIDPSPPPRPAPRVRPPRVTDSSILNGDPGDVIRSAPKPRERSHSPGSSSLSSETLKPKDPPWLALVQSEPRRKPAPPPPPGMAAPPRSGSAPSLRGEGSRPSTPPQPSNPFEDDNDEEAESGEGRPGEEVESAGSLALPPSHPWYGITQSAEAAGADSPAHTPGGGKKRPAPRVPRASPTALPHSQPSSTSPSPALSTESLSSDLGSSKPPPGDHGPDQEHPFTKSVSEPSISEPSLSSADHRPRLSPSPSPPPPPANTSSAPATPQTNRSAGLRANRPPPPRPPSTPSPLAKAGAPAPLPPPSHSKRICKENPFNRKASPSHAPPKSRPPKGPRPARPPAPGHGFPLIKRKVQSDQYIPVEDIHVEMGELEKQLDELEHRGVELESRLRDCQNDEEEEAMLVDWFTLIHDKHMLVRREAELVYTAKQQNLEERQADVEYELRCLLNKPEKEWSEEDRGREQELMAELVTIIEQRNHIINSMDQDRQREEEEDKVLEAVLKKKDFHKEGDSDHKKKSGKFKPMKVLKMLSQKGEGGKGKSKSPRKEKS
ncbi:hypothetical protein AAFF_G00208290 [Aldrovandia affinis]|uniref:MICAL-like protein 1 n=1 Tax=Aldrovandia affinis TaxID=143900 RepID=A0AAD7RHQ5_9TELE|nr:hypothetical protein AAFF_G00208290 [Aldrovandia affinis]